MPSVEQEVKAFKASGERSLNELKRVLSEEKEVEEKTRDRLSEIAEALRDQFKAEATDDDMVVVKETVRVGEGDDAKEYTRFRGLTDEEKMDRRFERGEQTLSDILMSGEVMRGLKNWRDASTWVDPDDDGLTAKLIRHMLGDNGRNIEKTTERIEGRENILREVKEYEKRENERQERESRSESSNESETESDEYESDHETESNNSERILSGGVLAGMLSDKDEEEFGESATEKENKSEELSLFNKQNAILKGIFDNTVKLVDSMNKLQILHEKIYGKLDEDDEDSKEGGILDLFGLSKKGRVRRNGKVILGKTAKAGSAILKKGAGVLGKAGSVGTSVLGSIFRGSAKIGEKAATSSIAAKTIEGMKIGGSALMKGGSKAGSIVLGGAKGMLRGLPVVGTLAAGTLGAMDYAEAAEEIDRKVADGEITKEEGERLKTEAKGSAAGSTVGAGVGATIGGAIGLLTPIPGGALIGSAIGSMIGGSAGDWIGTEAAGTLATKPEAKETKPKPPKTETPKPTVVPRIGESAAPIVSHPDYPEDGSDSWIGTEAAGTSIPEPVTDSREIGVRQRTDGAMLNGYAESIRQNESEMMREMKVNVVSNSVQNITNSGQASHSPMYSRNIDPSYIRTVDERYGIA